MTKLVRARLLSIRSQDLSLFTKQLKDLSSEDVGHGEYDGDTATLAKNDPLGFVISKQPLTGTGHVGLLV